MRKAATDQKKEKTEGKKHVTSIHLKKNHVRQANTFLQYTRTINGTYANKFFFQWVLQKVHCLLLFSPAFFPPCIRKGEEMLSNQKWTTAWDAYVLQGPNNVNKYSAKLFSKKWDYFIWSIVTLLVRPICWIFFAVIHCMYSVKMCLENLYILQNLYDSYHVNML